MRFAIRNEGDLYLKSLGNFIFIDHPVWVSDIREARTWEFRSHAKANTEGLVNATVVAVETENE